MGAGGGSTYDTNPGHKEQHGSQGQSHTIVAHSVEDGTEFLLACASEHPTTGTLRGEGAGWGRIWGCEPALNTRLALPPFIESLGLEYTSKLIHSNRQPSPPCPPNHVPVLISLCPILQVRRFSCIQYQDPLLKVAALPRTYTHGFKQVEDDVDRHDPGHQVDDLPADKEPAVSFWEQASMAGAGGAHFSLVKMYPSTSFVAAKMAPTATQNPPGKESKEVSAS